MVESDGTKENTSDQVWEEMMNKEILKYIIKKGDGDATAPVSTVVKCNLKGFIKERHEGVTKPQFNMIPFESLTDQCFQIGESDTIPAIELTLRHAFVGEIYRVRCTSKYGYGPIQRPINTTSKQLNTEGNPITCVPPDTPLEYEIEVVEHIDLSESGNASLSHRDLVLRDVMLRKECGNRWFGFNEFAKAGRAYSKGAQTAESYLKTGQDTQGNEVSNDPDSLLLSAYITCLNNLAACYISQKEFMKAKEICTRVLELSPNNVKALLRAAKASLALDLYEECELCLNAVQSIEPNNAAAVKEKERLGFAIKQYRRQEKAMALRTMKSSALATKETDDAANKNEINTQAKLPEVSKAKPLETESGDNKTNVPVQPSSHVVADKRGWSIILLLFTSVVVMLISIGIAWYLSSANTGKSHQAKA